jgi:hypothetical protein
MEMGRKLATAIAGLALLIMVGVPAGADASSTDSAKTDLSSLPAIEAYLTSIGVDPGAVVIQQGRFNYAGPNCPGAEWNCTTANAVVQISTATSGANIFDCLPAVNATFPALNECLIVQSSALSLLDPAPENSAICSFDITDDATKRKSKCTFRQTSKKGNNYAEARARTTERGGSTQSATQDANITQTSTSGRNTAKITETIEQTLIVRTPSDPTQKQEAHQTATVYQTSTTGNNSSDVEQTMLQVEDADSSSEITQEQNTDSTNGRNQVATITQTSTEGTGTNTSKLRHLITQRQDADCSICTITQRQGFSEGGQSGTVTQTTGAVVLTSTAAQNEDQHQDADTNGPLIRSQLGPQDCCATQNGTNDFNVNTVDQRSVQTQTPQSPGQTSVQTGNCKEIGSSAQCFVHQTITQNGTTDPNDCPPPETGSCVGIFHSCTGSEAGSLCTTSPPEEELSLLSPRSN